MTAGHENWPDDVPAAIPADYVDGLLTIRTSPSARRQPRLAPERPARISAKSFSCRQTKSIAPAWSISMQENGSTVISGPPDFNLTTLPLLI